VSPARFGATVSRDTAADCWEDYRWCGSEISLSLSLLLRSFKNQLIKYAAVTRYSISIRLRARRVLIEMYIVLRRNDAEVGDFRGVERISGNYVFSFVWNWNCNLAGRVISGDLNTRARAHMCRATRVKTNRYARAQRERERERGRERGKKTCARDYRSKTKIGKTNGCYSWPGKFLRK
jgi:hypothetical protein